MEPKPADIGIAEEERNPIDKASELVNLVVSMLNLKESDIDKLKSKKALPALVRLVVRILTIKSRIDKLDEQFHSTHDSTLSSFSTEYAAMLRGYLKLLSAKVKGTPSRDVYALKAILEDNREVFDQRFRKTDALLRRLYYYYAFHLYRDRILPRGYPKDIRKTPKSEYDAFSLLDAIDAISREKGRLYWSLAIPFLTSSFTKFFRNSGDEMHRLTEMLNTGEVPISDGPSYVSASVHRLELNNAKFAKWAIAILDGNIHKMAEEIVTPKAFAGVVSPDTLGDDLWKMLTSYRLIKELADELGAPSRDLKKSITTAWYAWFDDVEDRRLLGRRLRATMRDVKCKPGKLKHKHLIVDYEMRNGTCVIDIVVKIDTFANMLIDYLGEPENYHVADQAMEKGELEDKLRRKLEQSRAAFDNVLRSRAFHNYEVNVEAEEHTLVHVIVMTRDNIPQWVSQFPDNIVTGLTDMLVEKQRSSIGEERDNLIVAHDVATKYAAQVVNVSVDVEVNDQWVTTALHAVYAIDAATEDVVGIVRETIAEAGSRSRTKASRREIINEVKTLLDGLQKHRQTVEVSGKMHYVVSQTDYRMLTIPMEMTPREWLNLTYTEIDV